MEIRTERTMTEKGLNYTLEFKRTERSKLFKSLETESEKLKSQLDVKDDIHSIKIVHAHWMDLFEKFLEIHENIKLLNTSDQTDSDDQRMEEHVIHFTKLKDLSLKFFSSKGKPKSVASSVASQSSRGSSRHSHASNISERKAKVAAAKVKLEFAPKEAEIERQRIQLEQNKQILRAEENLQVALAEMKAYEEEEEVDTISSISQYKVQKPQDNGPNSTFAEEFSKYLVKKDLLVSRIQSFNDQPESYPVWKASFRNITKELDTNHIEELDLLVKYLGPVSSRQAQSIRVSNASNPKRAVDSIWSRLEERYGRPEMVDAAIKSKISKFPKITTEFTKLYDLADLASEIESIKVNSQYQTLLGIYDTSSGVNQILPKLPYRIQQKWIDRATKFKSANNVPYPPFSIFVNFLRDMSTQLNDPSFKLEQTSEPKPNRKTTTPPFTVRKTAVEDLQPKHTCPVHGPGHPLNACRQFRTRPLSERKEIIKENNICIRCCATDKHSYRNCQADIKCRECASTSHPTALHQYPSANHGGEKLSGPPQGSQHAVSKAPGNLNTRCTNMCGEGQSGRSCAKTVLVNVFPFGQPERVVRVYAILDDQSNKSLASSALFDKLDADSEVRQYDLNSCAGITRLNARHTSKLVVSSIDGTRHMRIADLVECDLPNVRSEIPTPDVTQQYPHLAVLAGSIPPLDNQAEIGLLLGRDVIEAHHVLDQIIGPSPSPFAQRLPLGWVILGEVCLGQYHKPQNINAMKTNITKDDRPTIFEMCENNIHVKESHTGYSDGIGHDIYKTSCLDEQPGLSQDDCDFIKLMDGQMKKDASGQFIAPLPFKEGQPQLSKGNRTAVLKRAMNLHWSLKRNQRKREHMVDFMKQVIDSGASEVAPSMAPEKSTWYLPLFGVYHPRKPDKIRGVFDSSMETDGTSLNNMLLTGPNLTNSLLGVLLRFRREPVAVSTDVQQMFYSFLVQEQHRDFLRYFWYQDNDPSKDLIEYRMRVHVFGNTPSPAVATYGLRKAVQDADEDVRRFVERDFYVDDGLTSCESVEEAISIVKRTQKTLHDSAKIRLHKISSNVPDVMDAFPHDDLEKNLSSVDIFSDDLPLQASLGLSWDLNADVFTFNLSLPDKPTTRRGVLSAVSSIFDPLGFLNPITIEGRMLVREITARGLEWDEPLPTELRSRWDTWKTSMETIADLRFPRMFLQHSWSRADSRKIHIFADASEQAIAAVAYVQAVCNTNTQVGFLMGKSKLSPQSGTTIPHLELCAAVLATELAQSIQLHLDVPPENFVFHSDSRVVLGYLNNRTRRFYTYVANRVQTILKASKASQWHYVSTEKNPADCGTRCQTPVEGYIDSPWIKGPEFLRTNSVQTKQQTNTFDLIDAGDDRELRPEIKATVTRVTRTLASRFEKFSTRGSLLRAFSLLKRVCRAAKEGTAISPPSVESDQETSSFLVKVAQSEAFESELKAFKGGQRIPANSKLGSLSPMVDSLGILRVGGRLDRAPISFDLQHPIIIPGKSHLAKLLVRHFHTKVQHQGRLFTESALRTAGYWIIGSKRLVSSLLHQCFICRKLRGRFQQQQMADLPPDRVTHGAPFSSVGIDTFGPWSVVARKTRGGHSESKRWAILFTCLTTRAVHIEVVEEMSSSAFINALRRFTAIRGPVSEIRSDRGTNFVGAIDAIGATAICVEEGRCRDYLKSAGIVWRFNPPHASHMGGVWERLIGVTRKILDAILLNSHSQRLTHDVLCTFMCEVSAIVNSRPIAPLSYDTNQPETITPAMLLTQKAGPGVALTTSTDIHEIYASQWKHVQILSNTFWKQWRDGYLQSLQTRRKWSKEENNIKCGDIVLLRDDEQHRNQWPMGVVSKAFKSDGDQKVRSVEIRIMKDGKVSHYVRPITKLILLAESV